MLVANNRGLGSKVTAILDVQRKFGEAEANRVVQNARPAPLAKPVTPFAFVSQPGKPESANALLVFRRHGPSPQPTGSRQAGVLVRDPVIKARDVSGSQPNGD
jgi:hypothetical protein